MQIMQKFNLWQNLTEGEVARNDPYQGTEFAGWFYGYPKYIGSGKLSYPEMTVYTGWFHPTDVEYAVNEGGVIPCENFVRNPVYHARYRRKMFLPLTGIMGGYLVIVPEIPRVCFYPKYHYYYEYGKSVGQVVFYDKKERYILPDRTSFTMPELLTIYGGADPTGTTDWQFAQEAQEDPHMMQKLEKEINASGMADWAGKVQGFTYEGVTTSLGKQLLKAVWAYRQDSDLEEIYVSFALLDAQDRPYIDSRDYKKYRDTVSAYISDFYWKKLRKYKSVHIFEQGDVDNWNIILSDVNTGETWVVTYDAEAMQRGADPYASMEPAAYVGIARVA